MSVGYQGLVGSAICGNIAISTDSRSISTTMSSAVRRTASLFTSTAAFGTALSFIHPFTPPTSTQRLSGTVRRSRMVLMEHSVVVWRQACSLSASTWKTLITPMTATTLSIDQNIYINPLRQEYWHREMFPNLSLLCTGVDSSKRQKNSLTEQQNGLKAADTKNYFWARLLLNAIISDNLGGSVKERIENWGASPSKATVGLALQLAVYDHEVGAIPHLGNLGVAEKDRSFALLMAAQLGKAEVLMAVAALGVTDEAIGRAMLAALLSYHTESVRVLAALGRYPTWVRDSALLLLEQGEYTDVSKVDLHTAMMAVVQDL